VQLLLLYDNSLYYYPVLSVLCVISNHPTRPQYYEIYKHGAVLGISLTFMAVDCLGGIFSILSLIFKSKFDVLAAVAYSLVVVRPRPRLPRLASL